MTEVTINGADTTTLHLCHLDLPPEAVARFTTMAGTGEWPLKYALGASALRPAFVEVIDLRDLGAMPLSRYLAEAHDIPAASLGSDAGRIDALTGHVVVLPAQAFDATSQTLTIAPPLTLVGSYGAPAARSRGAALSSAAARGQAGGGPPVAPEAGRPRGLVLMLLGLAAVILLTLALLS